VQYFRIDPLQDPRWKSFTDWHPETSIFHTAGWLQALRTTYGYAPVVLSTSAPGIPQQDGLLFCEVRSLLTGNRLVSLPFSDHCQPLVSNPDALESLVDAMTQTVEKQRWNFFEVRPTTCSATTGSGLAVSGSYYFHRVDLRPPEELVFKRFDKDCVQRKIRRAERESLRYEEGQSDKLLRCFYKLNIMTRRRHGLPPQPLKWFRSLIATLGKNLQIRIAFKGDTPIASIVTLTHKKKMVYKYGGSDLRYSNLGGNALVFWRAIQDAKAKDIEEFDMGRCDLDNQGLLMFKERWGAERSTLNYWRYPASSSHPATPNFIRKAKRLISVAPELSLKTVSNLLYRHMG
jgi:lipid II:glycine glycyltransferase (peptidoglycan interpeptide bridge formation enzyme)